MFAPVQSQKYQRQPDETLHLQTHTSSVITVMRVQAPTFILLSDVFISLDEVLLLGVRRQVGGLVHGHAGTLTLLLSSSCLRLPPPVKSASPSLLLCVLGVWL